MNAPTNTRVDRIRIMGKVYKLPPQYGKYYDDRNADEYVLIGIASESGVPWDENTEIGDAALEVIANNDHTAIRYCRMIRGRFPERHRVAAERSIARHYYNDDYFDYLPKSGFNPAPGEDIEHLRAMATVGRTAANYAIHLGQRWPKELGDLTTKAEESIVASQSSLYDYTFHFSIKWDKNTKNGAAALHTFSKTPKNAYRYAHEVLKRPLLESDEYEHDILLCIATNPWAAHTYAVKALGFPWGDSTIGSVARRTIAFSNQRKKYEEFCDRSKSGNN